MNEYTNKIIADFATDFNVHPDYRYSAMKYLFKTLMTIWEIEGDITPKTLNTLRLTASAAGLTTREIENTIDRVFGNIDR